MRTVRLSEGALRRMVKKIVAEHSAGAQDPRVVRAAEMIKREGETDEACMMLSRVFRTKPWSMGQDIIAALESHGVDPDLAFDVAVTCLEKYGDIGDFGDEAGVISSSGDYFGDY